MLIPYAYAFNMSKLFFIYFVKINQAHKWSRIAQSVEHGQDITASPQSRQATPGQDTQHVNQDYDVD